MKTLRARLALICGLLSLALCIVGITGFVSLKTVSSTYEHVAQVNLPNALLLQQMSLATGNSIRQIIRLGFTGLPDKEIEYLAGRFNDYAKKYEESDMRYKASPFAEGEEALYQPVAKHWQETLQVASTMISMRQKGDIDSFHKYLDGEFRTAYNAHGKALDSLIKFQEEQALS